ncbi:MAG: PhzF family phenazine biosynthesis protein [Pseudomonadales bacterium]
MELDIYQVDAFTDSVFGGNPAAVCPLDAWLSDTTLQAIASENNLSETAFFVAEGTGFRLRWFTPGVEVKLCGHATLATAKVLFEQLNYNAEQIVFHTLSGELRVRREGVQLSMDFPTHSMETIDTPAALTTAIGLPAEECFQDSNDDYMLVYPDQAAIEGLQPDMAALLEVPARGIIVTAPGAQYDFVSRFFGPRVGINEDPVTGSAHCSLTPYWARRLQKTQLRARQVSARGGDLRCELKDDRVVLTGQASLYMQGKIYV